VATQAKLDEFGRVVIPKSVRRNLGLEAGDVLELEESEGGILLRLPHGEPPVRRVGGVLVFGGEAAGDLREAGRRQREERAESVARRRGR
jgi:AbrB family looped-hinge helix DNA binding protein